MEVPTDMQAFFFEDINQMLNFSLDSINQQAEEYGGFQDDYSQVDDENFEAPSMKRLAKARKLLRMRRRKTLPKICSFSKSARTVHII